MRGPTRVSFLRLSSNPGIVNRRIRHRVMAELRDAEESRIAGTKSGNDPRVRYKNNSKVVLRKPTKDIHGWTQLSLLLLIEGG